ncbi:hypothetical protein Tsubulata_001841 [Turnera subulata]|uniref:Protein kinase domain-containing protein n=1 Tax=Turnera subulata TaxID=218843 RepID=A0A9Q0G5C5_9ROSI|nr:hypothetical protein Tsubulata_001841 [Turnera subulata]
MPANFAMERICLVLLLLVQIVVGQSDFEALLELKKSIEKDPSGKVLESWDSKSLSSHDCPQNWYGVVCVGGRVASLSLDDLGLVGNFSFPVLAGLQMLKNLSVSGNQLTGTISNVGSIESLELLDLSGNLFRGFIPSGMDRLKNLVLLNLSSNSFEGIVPSGLGNLQKLKYLDLKHNSFSGDIMNLLSQLGSLIYVDLSCNQFSGSLDLGLAKPGFISSIAYFNVSHNSLVGQLFAHDGVPYFDSLQVFDASYNQFTGAVPPFGFVVSLKILRLGSNQLSGPLPEALLHETSMVLSELDLSLNQIQGPVASITSATLKILNLSSNSLSGSLPITVGHCAIIDLSNNMLSGNLSRIQSWGNYVEVIQLSSNKLTGTFPEQTSQFLRLTTLMISNNSLNGHLPPVLCTYSQLKVIDLSLNSLGGLLLPNCFNSTTLTDLNLSANNITGSIPLQEIRESTQNLSLMSLDLSNNFLDGYLPPEISKFHNLVYLNLSHNKLEGNLPADLPDALKGLDVSSNNLSGVVPDNLRQFPDSAFHPGNSLLVFPYLPPSPKGATELTTRVCRSCLRPTFKIILIACMVGAVSLIALFCLLLYYKVRYKTRSRRSLKGSEESESMRQQSASIGDTSGIDKKADQSPSSFSFHQNPSPSHQQGTSYQGAASSGLKRPNDQAEFVQKHEGLPSPTSLLSSSNPSPSKSQLSPENKGAFKVYSPEKLAGDLHLFDGSVLFTAEELSSAPAELIGRSCHGALYKATLDSGNVLAIKWLKEGITKGRKEFAREIKKLGSIRHPNLVSLLGYYWGPKDHEKMIVSSYINAHCLAFCLQETESKRVPPLSLEERLGIAVTVAGCLNYLHNERAIPHGNLKSTNILIEPPTMNALLTDYSLHRVLTSAGTAEQVLNAGALGYRPPEFASSSKPCPSLKSDVYAFGVILLELLTGKCSGEIVSRDPRAIDLTDWVRILAEENRQHECFDKFLLQSSTNVDVSRVISEMLEVALRCILSASERPDMKSVFSDLSMLATQNASHSKQKP